MRKGWCRTLAMMLSVSAGVGTACAAEGGWTILAKGSLTTSSQIFYDPNSADPIERAQSNSATDSFGAGAELKYTLPEAHIAFGLGLDYVRAVSSNSIDVSPTLSIPVDDGYSVVTIEATGYFLIPVSGPTFGMYMGGGAGVYIGRRTYSWAGTSADLVDQTPGYGIHVLCGANYRLTPHISLLGEMKFRDLQFQTTNAFSVRSISYLGTNIQLPQQHLDASIHTDGIVFLLGASFDF